MKKRRKKIIRNNNNIIKIRRELLNDHCSNAQGKVYGLNNFVFTHVSSVSRKESANRQK